MSKQKTKIRVAVLGASGYTGAELVRLLARHPHVEIAVLTADRHAGQPIGAVFPHLGGLDLPALMRIEEVEWAGVDIDLIFCALPHGTTQEIVKGLLHASEHTTVDELIVETREDFVAAVRPNVRVVDLSADFRLHDEATYEKWYGHAHYAPELQAEAVYGLTEFYRERIRQSRLIANPGCYPTAALLPLVPLLERSLIEPEDIIIDAKSGVTGAGRSLKENMLFGEVAEGVHAYGVASHRHGPEIDQELSAAAGQPVTVNFTPHLMPMNRGELVTIYARLVPGQNAEDVRACLIERFTAEPFVAVTPPGFAPATRHVRGSNHCLIGVFADRVPRRIIIVAVIDNLVKGASGAAVQNMNVMFGLAETLALEQVALFP